MKAVQTNADMDRQGRPLKHMGLEQRVAVRKHYVAKLPRWRHPLIGYFVAIPLVGLILFGTIYLQHLLGQFVFRGTLSVLSVLIVALFWGVGPALFALLLSTCGLDYFLISPGNSFFLNNWESLPQLIPFVISGLAIALITAQREKAHLRALFAEQELQVYAAELEAINRKLEDADQTKDHFISVASHELKTPITTIRGQAQLMLRRISKQKKSHQEVEGVKQALERINDQTARLTMLIDELLDVSSIRAGKMEMNKRTCDIRHLCRDVVDDQRLLTGREIVLEVPSAAIKLAVDADRITQVIINLISNAVKYSPAESRVDVCIHEESHHIQIKVSDQGAGISTEQQERIFETFYRAPAAQSSETRGLGLGLAISKEIVERHGGRIWCASEPGKGSEFYVELPLA